MKRGYYIFMAMLFTLFTIGGCEKLVVPDYENDSSHKTEDKDESNTTDDRPVVGGDDKNDSSPDNNEPEDSIPAAKDDPENDNKQDESDEEDTPEDDSEELRDGYEDSPYLASDLSTGYIGKYIIEKGASITNCWVMGYIVGYINGTKLTEKTAVFTSGIKETNIIIADSPLETNFSQCVPIQLSSGSSYISTREALNLSNNPYNIGRKVKILGTLQKYMGYAGVKNTRKYKFIE